MQDLKIALIQADLVWEDPEANLHRFREKIDRVPAGVHLIVLPEMFSTGFSMSPARLAHQVDGQTVGWMKDRSRETGAHLTGSLIIEEKGHFYNRLFWVTPDGGEYRYDKKHLFRYAGEEKVYSPGDGHLLVRCHGWKIRPFICYDLRFPIWTRNLNNAYDAAIFVANWPRRRASHWKTLLKARAIENQCYVAGVNRVGVDGNGYTYSGDTCIIDPTGRLVAGMSHKEAMVADIFSAEALNGCRKNFPAWMDADDHMVIR
ncbi:carbon-nitrogen hydrolase [Desulfosarcina alkanivorans]|uniref:Omega-amidase YafV n=1 Tax=Desulfosarcina alkanivorans TaxID=571177 RepID=A0A5K7YEF4_9BACT|nr:amidohydrolase [Desulfosarcina alkanivorans]BBO67396.1 carbon-nitrogen hydrolase [Desulfosarcina alkanivorans]